MFADLRSTVEEARRLVGDLDPDGVTPAEAAGLLRELGQLARVATAGVTVLAARAAEGGEWRRRSFRDAGSWVADVVGLNEFDGRRLVEASGRMTPTVRERMVAGEVAPLKAAEVLAARDAAEAARRRWEQLRAADDAARNATDAAPESEPQVDAVPPPPPGKTPDEVEGELLELAERAALARMREEAQRQAAASRDQAAQHEHLRRSRSWRTRTFADGAVGGEYRLPPEVAAWANGLIEAESDVVFAHARRSGCHDPRPAYGADALVRLLAAAAGVGVPSFASRTDHGAASSDRTTRRHGAVQEADPPAPSASGSASTAGADDVPSSADPARQGCDDPVTARAADAGPPLVVPEVDGDVPASVPGTVRTRRRPVTRILRVDAEALLRDALAPGELCEIHGVGPVVLADALGLLADADLFVVLHASGSVLTVAHVGRWRPPDRLLAGRRLPQGSGDHAMSVTAVLRLDVGRLRPDRPQAHVLDVPGAGGLDATKAAARLGSFVDRVVGRAVAVREVAFDGRRWPAELRIAGLEEQPCCVDCGSPYRLEDDHDLPVALGGPTTLANLRRRCRSDHRAKSRREAPQTIRAGRRAARARRDAGVAPPDG